MSEEDIKYYNEKLERDSEIVLTAQDAVYFIKAYMKELIDRDDYDIEYLKSDMEELAGYIKDINCREVEYVAIGECAMSGTNICISILKPDSDLSMIRQVANWCMDNCDYDSRENMPKIFQGTKQIMLENMLLEKLQKA